MLFRLALRLGKTVQQLVSELSVDEFMEWIAFYRLEPWGYDHETRQSALVAVTVANASRPPKHPGYKLEQFLPQREKPQAAEEMLAKLKATWSG